MERPGGLPSKSYTVLIHVMVWIAFLLIPLIFIESATGRERFMIMGWFEQLLMALYFYYNFLFLIPSFFLRKRLWGYFLLLVAGFVVIGVLNIAFSYITFDMVAHRHPFNFWRAVFFPVYPAILAFALSSTVRIAMEWFRNERLRKEMEAGRLEAELAFLKSQVNPHFLFNTLNSICSLARKRSDETEPALIKLSQIMRYMLEDSKDEKVPLEKEVEYLHSYIELQRLRLAGSVKVDFIAEGCSELLSIEPLLLIPFVENAFKHGPGTFDPSVINIRLSCSDARLTFAVDNSFTRHREALPKRGSGIGLKNVKRRLDLLYPGKHRLDIREQENHYCINLEIRF